MRGDRSYYVRGEPKAPMRESEISSRQPVISSKGPRRWNSHQQFFNPSLRVFFRVMLGAIGPGLALAITSCQPLLPEFSNNSDSSTSTESVGTDESGSTGINNTDTSIRPDPAPQKQQLNPNLPTEPSPELLQESWDTYRQRFIQEDGRVIDWEAESRSTSESQAYAMLRAVLADDPETFARTLEWAQDNLARPSSSQPGAPLKDQLWSWNWGMRAERWVVLDPNFATDGDIDAATALILAARRWNRPDYLALAQLKLKDIWQFSTATLGDQRYLLPGPQEAFVKGDRLQLNPSYLAPYAFRLFATVDPERDWSSLVSSSYQVLESSSELSALGLPSDWIEVTSAGNFQPITQPSKLNSRYSFDAYRVWWRVALDATWFDAPEAKQYLNDHLSSFRESWQQEQRILAQYNLAGEPLANYEATSQYGMLYPALKHIAPEIAAEMFQFKLLSSYKEGLWDDESAYYSQNLAWLGLFPFEVFSETVR